MIQKVGKVLKRFLFLALVATTISFGCLLLIYLYSRFSFFRANKFAKQQFESFCEEMKPYCSEFTSQQGFCESHYISDFSLMAEMTKDNYDVFLKSMQNTEKFNWAEEEEAIIAMLKESEKYCVFQKMDELEDPEHEVTSEFREIFNSRKDGYDSYQLFYIQREDNCYFGLILLVCIGEQVDFFGNGSVSGLR